MSYFQSPLHPHILCLRNLSPHFEMHDCDFCRGGIDGSTSIYCCEKCVRCIHTSCAAPPRQIQHPRHQHPLDLQLLDDKRNKGLYYRCVEFDHGCDFKLIADTAMETLQVEKYYCSVLREASDGESRLQFAHEHPLTSFPVRTGNFCEGCEMWISEEEEAYGCSECSFSFHEACAKPPLEIHHHPLHPKHPLFLFYDPLRDRRCRACDWRNITSRTRYRCEECKLIFDLSCVISTMPCEGDDDDEREDLKRRSSAIDHPLHPHRLSSYHSKTRTKIKCRYCDKTIPSGDFYGCSDCFFFLHGSCARPPADAIQHYLHPEHTLTFAKYANEKERCCPICEGRVSRDSYCYTCEMCDFFIHPICATATLSDLEEGGAMTVKYPFHEHELKLYYTFNASGSCSACEGYMGSRILAYKCFSKGCKFKIHKSCLQPPSELEHPSHSLHPLTFCFPPPNEDITCHGCYKRINGTFAFSCGECKFYLHLKCAKKPTLKHPFHEHHLFYFKETTYESMIDEGRQNNRKCRACRKSCGVDYISCEQCNFSLHYECSQLPPTIKSEHHWEPLVLRESYKEDDLGKYYCDICERRRDPNKWVYFCETCETDAISFVAHVECALSRVKLEVIEEADFIRLTEDIEKQEKEVREVRERLDAKKASLRPLREELESQRAELKKLKIEHAKWINMGVIEEDESIRGEENNEFDDGELEKLRVLVEELETEQANWLIEFLKTKCNLPTSLFSRTTGTSSPTGTAQSVDDYLIDSDGEQLY